MDKDTFSEKGKIVVGYDGSKYARGALAYAAKEALLRRSSLILAMAWQLNAYDLGVTQDAMETLQKSALDTLKEGAAYLERNYPDVVFEKKLLEGESAYALLELASQADLFVVGARGKGGFSALLLGSVSDQLIHHAKIPVLVVR